MLKSNTSKEKISLSFCLRGESETVGVDICFFMEAYLKLREEHSGLYSTLYPNAIIWKMEKKMEG